MRNLPLLLALLFTSRAFGNIYSCNSPSGKPYKNDENIKTELSISTLFPFIKSHELNYYNLKDKKPFLIYYAIDSSEDFMQISVRYEIARLQTECKQNSNVNFVGLINSLYVKKNQILICKNKKFSYVNLRDYTSLNKKLITIKKSISSGIKNGVEIVNLNLSTKYPEQTKKAFSNFPLAHPNFLHELIYFVSNETKMFPASQFAPFIHLKSHGSRDYVLSGMYECQSKAKEISARKIIKRILSKHEYKMIRILDTFEKVATNIDVYEKIISKIDLGHNRGIGSFKPSESNLGAERLGSERLGAERLNITGNSLGNAYNSLGVNEGLGAGTGFGTSQNHLDWVLQNLYKTGSNKSLGFLMLESCDTKRDPNIHHANLDNIYGYYTAKASLWYRNLNWWDILKRANGSTVKLVQILYDETPFIPNIEVVSKIR